MYCFVHNEYYKCGNNNNNNIATPECNETLKSHKVLDIKCGGYHNVIKTDKNHYYLWGNNGYNQCLHVSNSILSYFSNPPKYIKKPLLFDSSFLDKDQEIMDIYVGFQSTRILLVNQKENPIVNDNNDDEKKTGFI